MNPPPKPWEHDVPVDFSDEESPTGRDGSLTAEGRVKSRLDELTPAEQERALRLLSDWIACGNEERHSLSWLARLLSRA